MDHFRPRSEAIRKMGIKPINKFGTCFDAVGSLMLRERPGTELVVCHGIGISNWPGKEGQPCAHAWIETRDRDGVVKAFDPIWGIKQNATVYRQNGKFEYVVTYTCEEFFDNWILKSFPGPWDDKIAAQTIEGKQASNV